MSRNPQALQQLENQSASPATAEDASESLPASTFPGVPDAPVAPLDALDAHSAHDSAHRAGTESFVPPPLPESEHEDGGSNVRRAPERTPTIIMPLAPAPELAEEIADVQDAAERVEQSWEQIEAAELELEELEDLELIIAEPVEHPERMQTVVFSPRQFAEEEILLDAAEATDGLQVAAEPDAPSERLPTVMLALPIIEAPAEAAVEAAENARAESGEMQDAPQDEAAIDAPPPARAPRIPPRRKRRQARRAARQQVQEEAAALENAAEIEQLLHTLGPQVIECWSAQEDAESTVVVNSAPELVDHPTAPLLLVNEYVPQVVEVRAEADEPVQASARVPIVELAFKQLPTNTLSDVEVDAPLEDERTPTEIELSFGDRQRPRRRALETTTPEQKRRTRKASRPDPREREMRRMVRGSTLRSSVAATIWEANLKAELGDADLVAALGRLLDQWQRDGQAHQTNTLLIASLGAAPIAAEVTMRAAQLLVERTDSAVLAVDADPNGLLSRKMECAGTIGLSDLIAPPDAHGEAIRPTSTSRLHLLPRGKNAWPSSVAQASVHHLLAELAHEYAWILVSAGHAETPLVQALARACRGVYVAAPVGELPLADAQRELANLRNAGARVLGSIVVRND
jgi:hypothetical protein